MYLSLTKYLGFDPGRVTESNQALVARIQEQVLARPCVPTSLTNGIHLGLRALVRQDKLTRTESASLHAVFVLGR